MSEGRFIGDTLEAVIVAMAESLHEAQTALSATPPLDAYGRPTTRYVIPYLDFEMGFEVDSKITDGTNDRANKKMAFKPAKSTDQSVTSTIKGRFVAVPPGEGLPVPVLDLALEGSGTTRALVIGAGNSAGEVLDGVQVEVNVDEELTRQLGGVGRAEVTLSDAAPITDASGRAKVEVSFRGGAKGRVALAVELGGERQLLVMTKDN